MCVFSGVFILFASAVTVELMYFYNKVISFSKESVKVGTQPVTGPDKRSLSEALT